MTGLVLRDAEPAGERWTLDLDVATLAKMGNPHDIRDTIDGMVTDKIINNIDDPAMAGSSIDAPAMRPLCRIAAVKTQIGSTSGFKPGRAYHLNDAATLLVLTRLRTPEAEQAILGVIAGMQEQMSATLAAAEKNVNALVEKAREEGRKAAAKDAAFSESVLLAGFAQRENLLAAAAEEAKAEAETKAEAAREEGRRKGILAGTQSTAKEGDPRPVFSVDMDHADAVTSMVELLRNDPRFYLDGTTLIYMAKPSADGTIGTRPAKPIDLEVRLGELARWESAYSQGRTSAVEPPSRVIRTLLVEASRWAQPPPIALFEGRVKHFLSRHTMGRRFTLQDLMEVVYQERRPPVSNIPWVTAEVAKAGWVPDPKSKPGRNGMGLEFHQPPVK